MTILGTVRFWISVLCCLRSSDKMDDKNMEKLFQLLKRITENDVRDEEMITPLLEIIREVAKTKDCVRVGIGGGIKFILDCIPTRGGHSDVENRSEYDMDILDTLLVLFSRKENSKLFIDLGGFDIVQRMLIYWREDKSIQIAGFKLLYLLVLRGYTTIGAQCLQHALGVEFSSYWTALK